MADPVFSANLRAALACGYCGGGLLLHDDGGAQCTSCGQRHGRSASGTLDLPGACQRAKALVFDERAVPRVTELRLND